MPSPHLPCPRHRYSAQQSVPHQNFTTMPTNLDLARRLLALSQVGLHFTTNEYDRERYRETAQLAAQLLANESNLPAERLLSTWCVEDGYATPKVDVRGAVFRERQVLLVRETTDGRWTLPG